MSNKKREIQGVIPGIVKDGFEKPKEHKTNPTLQVAVQELPTAEKSVMYREYYASTLSFSTCMPMNGEFSIEFITQVAPVSKAVNNSPYKKLDHVAKVQVVPIETEQKIVAPEIVAPQEQQQMSDIELAMKYANVDVEPEAKKVSETLNIDISIPEVEEEQVNVFESINMMKMVTPVEEKTPQVKRSSAKQVRPFMVVDKVEVRLIENKSGETIYMIGNEFCDHAKFEVFKQEVSGKILAMDCKRIELHGVVYTKQPDGVYINSHNDVVTIDDLLNTLHG